MKEPYSAMTQTPIIALRVVDFFVFLRVQFLKKSILCLVILVSVFSCTAQSPSRIRVVFDTPQYTLGFRGGYGFIIPHRASMTHLITGHVISNELFFEKCEQTRNWQEIYRLPSYGFSFYLGYLANPNVLGNAYALDYFSNFHLIKKNRFVFDLRLASGIGYLSKTFDPDANNQNIAIGSKINISIGASFDFKWRVGELWQVGTGISLKHFSNGAFTTPNLGLNIPVLMITAKRYFNSPEVPTEYTSGDEHNISKIKEQHFPHFGYLGMFGYGVREIAPPGGRKMGIYSLELNVRWHKTTKSAYLAGGDIIHNVALYNAVKNDSNFVGTGQKDITQFALNIGYAQQFDKFELYLVNGFYVYSVSKRDGPVYQRIGGRYYIRENYAVQFALKTHFAKADYFEIGFGYIIHQKYKSPPNEIW